MATARLTSWFSGATFDSGLSKGVVAVMLGHGDGTFQPPVTYDTAGPPGGWASRVAIADVNGDCKPDVAAADYADSTV